MPSRPSQALTMLACACVAGVSPACSTGTSRPPEAPVRLAPEFTVNHDAWREVGYRWDWTSRPPLRLGGQIAFADAFEDIVIVQGADEMISVIEAPTGKIRWHRPVGDTATRFLGNVRRNGSIIVTNETELFEFDLDTGNTLDRIPLKTIATTRPILFGDIAVLGTSAGRLIALDMVEEIRRWEYQFDGEIRTPPLRIDDNTLSVVSTRGELRTLEADTANTVSSARISGDAGDSMVTDGEYIYLASLDQSVYAFDIHTGERAWRIRDSAPVTVQPVLIGGVLFVTTRDTGLTAITAKTGEILWSNPDIGGWVVTTNDSDLMVWNGRALLRVDAQRGDVIAVSEFDNLAGLRADSSEQGTIYAITRDGAVARFSAR